MINFQNDCESYLNFKSKIFLVIVKQKRSFLMISQVSIHWPLDFAHFLMNGTCYPWPTGFLFLSLGRDL